MATDAIAWLCKETTDTTGTGTYTTSGTAADGDHTTFTAILDNGDSIIYLVHSDGNNFEVTEGTWTEATKQLSRDTIIYSTNGGAAVNWGAGTKDIYGIQPVHDTSTFALTANNLSDLADAPTARTNLGLGTAALEAVAKFVLTDASSTIDVTGVLDFILQNGGSSNVSLRIGDTTSGKQYRLRRTGAVDELRLFHWDGVSTETELIKFVSTLVTMGQTLRLSGDGVAALDAATVQQVNAAGLQLASGDELLWIGASVPSGFTLKTGSTTYDDRMIRSEATLGQLGDTGGDYDWKDSLGGDVDNHTLTAAEMPPHNHDVTVFHDTKLPGDSGTLVSCSLVRTTSGSADRTYTSDNAGSGNAHKHNLTSVTSWRPKWRKWGTIAKT